MSAVDDVDARLCRLEEKLQLTQTQLLELSTQRQYNPTLGVDEDRSGRSVATLEVAVLAARNLVFQSGLFAGRGAYVRATLDPPGAALDAAAKCTQKQSIATTPCWQETLVFHGMTQLHSQLKLEVLQEERLGADRVVGVLSLDVSALHDQRPTEKWHALATRDQQPSPAMLYLSCRLNRSLIFALELESELLQNQIRELRAFVQRQRPEASLGVSRTSSGRSLDGKDVSHRRRTPPRIDARLEAMHSPVMAVRKRERRQSSSGPLVSPVAAELQQPRIKRRKLEPVTETHVESLSTRLANWLLPETSSSSLAAVAPSPIKRRPQPSRPVGLGKKKKKSPALAALESWLFQDAASGSAELVHAQMRAES